MPENNSRAFLSKFAGAVFAGMVSGSVDAKAEGDKTSVMLLSRSLNGPYLGSSQKTCWCGCNESSRRPWSRLSRSE